MPFVAHYRKRHFNAFNDNIGYLTIEKIKLMCESAASVVCEYEREHLASIIIDTCTYSLKSHAQGHITTLCTKRRSIH